MRMRKGVMAGVGGKDNVGSRDRGVCKTSSRFVNRIGASQRGLIWATFVGSSQSPSPRGADTCDAVGQVATRRFRDTEQVEARQQVPYVRGDGIANKGPFKCFTVDSRCLGSYCPRPNESLARQDESLPRYGYSRHLLVEHNSYYRA